MFLAMAFSAAVAAQTPSTPPPTQQQQQATSPGAANGKNNQGRGVDKRDKKKGSDVPDAAVLGFLGDYEDAGDGLDPMGLSDDDAAVATKGKDGHGP